jgi:hypothetical protein
MEPIEIFFTCVLIFFAGTITFGVGWSVYEENRINNAIEDYCLTNNYEFNNRYSSYGPICYAEINNTLVQKLVPKEVYE